ncbi:hypothetical protein DIPPA_00776 [Diplonema papillatum]|nr:hypothetical protein DIPPA_00776 [Diplonema papillatum]
MYCRSVLRLRLSAIGQRCFSNSEMDDVSLSDVFPEGAEAITDVRRRYVRKPALSDRRKLANLSAERFSTFSNVSATGHVKQAGVVSTPRRDSQNEDGLQQFNDFSSHSPTATAHEAQPPRDDLPALESLSVQELANTLISRAKKASTSSSKHREPSASDDTGEAENCEMIAQVDDDQLSSMVPLLFAHDGGAARHVRCRRDSKRNRPTQLAATSDVPLHVVLLHELYTLSTQQRMLPGVKTMSALVREVTSRGEYIGAVLPLLEAMITGNWYCPSILAEHSSATGGQTSLNISKRKHSETANPKRALQPEREVFLNAMHAFAQRRQQDNVVEVLHCMVRTGAAPCQKTVEILLHAMVKSGKTPLHGVVHVMLRFCDAGLRPTEGWFTAIARGVVSMKEPVKCAAGLMEAMVAQKIAPSHNSYIALLRACAKEGRRDEARRLHIAAIEYGYAEEENIHLYLLRANRSKPELVLRIWKTLSKCGASISAKCYIEFMRSMTLFAPPETRGTAAVIHAEHVFRTALECLPPASCRQLYTELLLLYIKSGDDEAMQELVAAVSRTFDAHKRPRPPQFDKVLRRHAKGHSQRDLHAMGLMGCYSPN